MTDIVEMALSHCDIFRSGACTGTAANMRLTGVRITSLLGVYYAQREAPSMDHSPSWRESDNGRSVEGEPNLSRSGNEPAR